MKRWLDGHLEALGLFLFVAWLLFMVVAISTSPDIP